mgnify:FL=1
MYIFSTHSCYPHFLLETRAGIFPIYLKGIHASAQSFFANAAGGALNGIQLHLLPKKEEAAYFFNDMESLAGREKVLFFPSSARNPYHHEEVANANIILRTEVLNRISRFEERQSVLHIVSFGEALAEKVVTRKNLSKNTIIINRGEKADRDFLEEVLTGFHFEKTDFVVEPGHFAIRGGIMDVWSFSSDYPVRIELFGDEVDSIRSFDPVQQTSIANLMFCELIPRINDKSIFEDRINLLDFIPENTLIWVQDPDVLIPEMDMTFQKAEEAYAKLEGPIKHSLPEQLFDDGNYLKEKLREGKIIVSGISASIKAKKEFQFRQLPQPEFNRKFDLLLEQLTRNIKEGGKTIITSESEKQINRLESIFRDLGKEKAKNENLFIPAYLNIHAGFSDEDLKISVFTDHQIFGRYHKFKISNSAYKKNEALTLKELKGLNPGDYVVHIDHGIGRFAGLEKIEVNGKLQDTIRILYKDNDLLNISIHALHRISKYAGKDGQVPRIDKIGSGAWAALKQKSKKKAKEIAYDLISLYAKRKKQSGFTFSPDNYLQNELEASFIYEDTPDQLKATLDVKADMEKEFPMDRLVCGDVGFGKTEVAIRAAFKAVNDGKQVAVLVPTTILALQHYKTFRERLAEFPVKTDYISRFKSAKEQKLSLAGLAEGKIDIIIGTHRLVGKDIKFKDLGLLIIDEEQKFGVGVKDKLKLLKANVDTLTLTATPIPRTLQFSLMGARDLSVINTPPPNRYPIQTELHIFNEELIRDAITYEIERRGQIFFIHNRVQSLPEMAGLIKRLCPEARIAMGHGQMDGAKLEQVMLDFIEGQYDVLVCTTIVESGLDIPNANTIIINEAQNFGLSDLHQMRGRVGRTNQKAFCYLLVPSFTALTEEARKRLKAIEQFSDLGSGFMIAMKDLDIRGAGNLLGAEQSGFINEIGHETYLKILNEAMEEVRDELGLSAEKGNIPAPQGKEFVKDCQMDTDLELMIPDNYVPTSAERIFLYKELDSIQKKEDLEKFKNNLEDRFGPVPEKTLQLIASVELRWLAQRAGIEKILIRSGKLTAYFPASQDDPYYQSEIFGGIIKYLRENPSRGQMRDFKGKPAMVIEGISSIEKAQEIFREISAVVTG